MFHELEHFVNLVNLRMIRPSKFSTVPGLTLLSRRDI